MTAETLNCPTCGAAISSDASQCQYCRAQLATVACPSCFGLAFVGSKFCPHCGKELSFPADVPTGLQCPRCTSQTMEAVSLKETKLLECPKCCGLWLAKATFTRICNSQVEQVAVLDLKLAPKAEQQVDPNRRYLPCPVCKSLMNRVNFAHHSGIVIDLCGKDGVWFDRDELRLIIEYIRGGGVERARKADQEKLAEQVRQLEMRREGGSPGSLLGDGNDGDVFAALGMSARSLWNWW